MSKTINRKPVRNGRIAIAAGVALLAIGAALIGLGATGRFLPARSGRFEARTIIRADLYRPDRTNTFSSPGFHSEPYFIQTEFEVLRSQLVLDKVIAALDLNKAWAQKGTPLGELKTSESREMLRRMIKANALPGTNLFELRVSGGDQKEVGRIANSVADAYVDYHRQQRQELLSAQTNSVQAQVTTLNEQIAAAQRDLQQFRAGLGIADTDLEATNAPDLGAARLEEDTKLKIENEAELVKTQTLLAKLKPMDPKSLRQALPTAVPDPAFISLFQDSVNAQEDLGTLQADHPNDDPAVVKAKGRIADLEQKLDARAQGIVAAMEVRVQTLKKIVNDCRARIEVEQKEAAERAEKIHTLRARTRDLKALEQKRASLQMDIQNRVDALTPDVAIVERATPPTKASARPQLARLLAIAFGTGFSLGGLSLLLQGFQAQLRPDLHEARRR